MSEVGKSASGDGTKYLEQNSAYAKNYRITDNFRKIDAYRVWVNFYSAEILVFE